MTTADISTLRLHNQRLVGTRFTKPEDVVSWFVAVQAQDYLGALWGVGQRLGAATEASVEQAIADRTIVRTWPMRGTLHFVAAADARWVVDLLAPRIVARHARRHLREYGLDNQVAARSGEVLVKELEGGKMLARNALYESLERAGIATGSQRGLHIVLRLAQEGLLCFGPRQGKQPTFVLRDEWVPDARRLDTEEALAELARRYFTGHGPATVPDFVWWSGLTVAEAQQGLAEVRTHLVEKLVDGRSYWMPHSMPEPEDTSDTASLLPAYDEYTVAYRDRSAVLDPAHAKAAGNGIFTPTIVVNGQVVGTWKRALSKTVVAITPVFFRPLKRTEREAVETAAEQYGRFLGLPVSIVVEKGDAR